MSARRSETGGAQAHLPRHIGLLVSGAPCCDTHRPPLTLGVEEAVEDEEEEEEGSQQVEGFAPLEQMEEVWALLAA